MLVRQIEVSTRQELESFIVRLGQDAAAARTLSPRGLSRLINVSQMDAREAAILRQELLTLGGEVAMNEEVARRRSGKTDVIVLANLYQLVRLVPRLAGLSGQLPELGRDLERLLEGWDHFVLPPLECGRFTLPVGAKTFVMGIINMTDDSFAGGGFLGEPQSAIERAERFIAEGADIIDIGGESARADVPAVRDDEEIERVIPVIQQLAPRIEVPISIDTYKPRVAEAAVRAGATMINDISGLTLGTGTADVAARYNVPLVLNHTYERPKVRPSTPPRYDDVMAAVIDFLGERIDMAQRAGVRLGQLILDPGVAFGKSHEQDLEVIRRLSELRLLRRPIMLALSRKNFIGSVLGDPSEDRLEGTIAAASLGVASGADIVRVHDVREVARAIAIADAVVRPGGGRYAPSDSSWPRPAAAAGENARPDAGSDRLPVRIQGSRENLWR
ncbi:MAG: dihydropteroate synthase [Dehalococcoidia bacterium]|nr:dihydropteroate synthase [Dehalococcoidia bacterium]